MLPGSYIPAINREGVHTSEQNLAGRTPMAARQNPPPLPPPDEEGPEDRRRIADARILLGDDSLEERKLTVPAGSLVLCHHDLYHRGSRALVDSAPWRPMFGIRNLVRVSDPAAPTWAEDDASEPTAGAFSYTGAPHEKQVIWEEMFSCECSNGRLGLSWPLPISDRDRCCKQTCGGRAPWPHVRRRKWRPRSRTR